MEKVIRLIVLTLFLVLADAITAPAQTKAGKYAVRLTVTEKGTHEPVVMATCSLDPLGAVTVTDADGKASVGDVPAGVYRLKVSYVGYEEYVSNVKVGSDLALAVQLTPTSLALQEVVVTARQNASGTSTSSTIGRQAIDHLQAASLADIMQLIPGQVIQNTDLTAPALAHQQCDECIRFEHRGGWCAHVQQRRALGRPVLANCLYGHRPAADRGRRH